MNPVQRIKEHLKKWESQYGAESVKARTFVLSVGVPLAIISAFIAQFKTHLIDPMDLQNESCLVSIPLGLILSVIYYRWGKRYWYPRKIFLVSLPFAFVLPIMYVSQFGGLINRGFDYSPTQTIYRTVWYKYVHKNSTIPEPKRARIVLFRSWKHPKKSISLVVDQATYEKSIPYHSVYKIDYHKGALGYEWWESYSLTDRIAAPENP